MKPPTPHHRPLRRAIPSLVVGLVLFARFSGAAPGIPRVVTSVVSENDREVVVTLEAQSPVWTPGGGYVYPRLDGFGMLGLPGHPALPIRILRVGIPEGTQPRLEILDERTSTVQSGRVGPGQRWVPLLPGSEDRIPIGGEDAAIYEADAFYPAAAPVRLGAIGSQREQPFVEIVFTPVLHNPARGVSTVTTRVTVRIDFGPIEPGAAPALESAGSEDPGFEASYDRGLVNYDQARRFRRSAEARGVEASDLSREGSSTLAPVSARYKMVVNRNGLYRLSASWAAANAPDVVNRPVANLRVDCQGAQVPITVIDANSDGTFNGSDLIELYGQALTWDILSADEWEGGDFTDDNVYWIYADSAAGLRASSRAAAPTDTLPIPVDFSETVHHEVDNWFAQQVPADPVTHWYQTPAIVASGSAGNPGPDATKTFSVATPGVSSGPTATASIKVRLLGETYINNLHRSSIKLNGTTVSGPSDWDDFREFTHGVDDGPASFTQSLMNDGTPDSTNVSVSLLLGRCTGVPCPGPTSVSFDQVVQNWIEITYGRLFKAGTDDALTFSVPNANAQIKVTGLSSNQTAVYEITKTLSGSPIVSPVRVTGARAGGAGPFYVEFEVLNDPTFPATRRFIVAAITASGTTGDLLPAAVRVRPASYLRTPPTGADWLVVYNASVVNTGSSSWTNLKARRQSQGLRVVTVDVEDVYDEFSHGIVDPQGIRDFFAWVYANWPRVNPAVPLKYGILLGDASLDPKNNHGYPLNKNLLPTYLRSVTDSTILGYMMDDSYFANVAGGPGDAIPDFTIGRWPSHSIAETNAYADKILSYETQSIGPPRPTWQYNDVFVADNDDPTFMSVQEDVVAQYLSNTPEFMNGAHTSKRTYERLIQIANPGWTPAQVAAEMRDRIIRQLNGTVEPGRDIGPGAAVLSYVGHGSWQDWGSDFSFFHVASSGPDDLTTVTNATKLPLIVVADCISGGFGALLSPTSSDISSVFAEVFVNRSGKGAIGVIAPTHLTTQNAHETVLGNFFDDVYGRVKLREMGLLNLGIQMAFAGNGDLVNLRSYTLFADPALKLVVPLPGTTTSVTPTPGNHQVTLNWSAVAGATSYNVYISSNPTGPYARVNGSQIAGTSHTVGGLTNCTPYYFNVTAIEASSFEGSYSHPGCGFGGPCVLATPRVSTPPSAPPGVTAIDNETGGAVRVEWDANAAVEEVIEHTVYWGTSPGMYTEMQSAGAASSWLITGLINGQTYYFAVSASNCSQGEGPRTAAAPVVPRSIEGIKPPNAIDDLMVLRSPDAGDHIDDIRLQWTPPTMNVYGQPTTLLRQDVYAGTSPTFAADAPHLIATLSPTASFYIHENAFAGPTIYYYHVVAVDTQQNRSGIGRELPRGIDGLTVARSGASSLAFNWPAVTMDLDSRPTLISKYVLYGQVNPFRRSQIATVPIVRDNLSATTVTIPTPPGAGLFCYSVIAVDNKGAQSPW